jgi:hypothetical protein
METIRLRTHGDSSYIEEKLGRELYSQMRGMPRIADFRRQAIARAYRLYEQAVAAGAPEPEVTGLGLLTLQRALLACEDLGALLYALGGKPQWLRFTSYTAPDLDETFAALHGRDLDVRALWSMPSDEAIAAEPGITDEQREAMRKLRDLTAAEIEERLDAISSFWVSQRVSIKNISHGFSVVPAKFLVEHPGAGVLSDQVDLNHRRPFAASLVSSLDNEARTVETTTYTIDLSMEAIGSVRDTAETACDLLERLAEAWRIAVESHHLFVLRKDLIERLSDDEQAAIAQLLEVSGAETT